MQTLRVAIAGFGNIGRLAADLLLSRRDRYRTLYGTDVRLVAVCGSRAGLFVETGLDGGSFDALEPGKTGPEFIAAASPDVLIDAGPSDFRTGGPGLAYLRAALSAGRDVVAISKGALVHDSRGLRELALASGAMLKISGATAAALPTIDLLDYSLKACSVLRLEGILNGTTNYLLDAMTTRGIGFDEALSEAQAAGIAEADPRNDTEGWDTACKLLILANFGLGLDLSLSELAVEGIQDIKDAQIQAWRAAGLTPKLVGSLSRVDGTVQARVGVRTYPAHDLFAHVAGKNKAIRIATDAMGEIMATGGASDPGATAAAALKDFEHILERRLHRPAMR